MSFDDFDLDHIPSNAHRLYRLIHDLYVVVDAGDRDVLEPFGLTPSQYRVLVLLDADYGQRHITLSDRLLVARSTITRLIDQMEDAGWVHRVDDPSDRRAQHVSLTPLGLTLRNQAYAAHEHSIEDRMGVLGERDQQRLIDFFLRMRADLRNRIIENDSQKK
ncbi:MAG: MarR family transcriptional regulator [Anaerolineae bacterium]|nr:MAG: MarR family transcriptional regulator [Anaerolineae bacterium]